MAKTRLEINKDEFQKVVTDLEASQTFENPSMLWKAVEATDWAKSLHPRALTAAVAYVRAKELGITYKTPAGKRGGALKGRVGGDTPRLRVPRSKKMEAFASTFARMRQETPKRYLPLVDKAEKGSLKACLKLKCLECANWQAVEVKLCEIISCPLFPTRPFQGKKVEEEEVPVE